LTTGRVRVGQLALGLLRMSRWSLVLLAAGASLVGARLANVALAGFCVALVAVANGLLSAASMFINDWHDVEEDRINRPTRPIPAGVVSRRAALIAAFVAYAAAIGLAVVASPTLGVMVIGAGLVSAGYTFWLKRVPLLGNVAVGLIGAFPLWCWLILPGVRRDVPLVLAASCLLYIAGKEVMKTGEDAPGDRAAGVDTIATRFGVPTANRFGSGMVLGAVVTAWVPVWWQVASPVYVSLLGLSTFVAVAIASLSVLRPVAEPRTSRAYSIALHVALFVMLVAMALGVS